MVHTLHKMVEAALTSKAGVKWGHVLHYLDAHCEESETRDNTTTLPYSSPLPAYYVATEDLAKQLRPDGITGESVLRTALKGAPARVIAALCQLGPQALEVTDHRGRLPLHLACRRTAEDPETETVLTILVDVFPLALLHRDDGGRTPLHWLFWYQAPSRSPEITSKFCQALPKAKFYALKQHHDTDKKYPLPEIPRPSAANKVPHNAAIIPDARLGCLPIHFAVMEGACDNVVQVLLQAYPMGKNVCDRFGRTVCHWYLGAGYVRSGCSHVSGEARDPNAPEWWNKVLSLDTLRLVLSSRVARTADCLDRHPLHWACELLACNYYRGTPEFLGKCISLPAIQLLLDHHIGQLTSQDHESQTPIMVMLDTIGRLQDSDWKLNGGKDRTLDLVHGGPTGFDPPLALVHMLLTYPDPMAETQPGVMEDDRGRLPIHAALAIAASPAVIDLLIQNNPMALVHTTEESLQAPLHAAFSRPWIAPLQSVETVELVLRTYTADKYGTVVDGRLAMKMEDAAGSYPLHYACQNKACVEVVKMLVEKFPMTASLQNSEGDLPLHCLLEDDVVKAMTSTVPDDKSKEEMLTEKFEPTRQKMAALIHPLIWDASKLGVAGSKHGMMPLHVAVLFEAAPYSSLLRMLELNSEAASHFTSHPDGTSFSVLDLHELCKSRYEGSAEEWQYIRELFFSFTPTLESHRHREELLDHCVRVVINELNGSGSYHSHVPKLPYKNPSVSQMLSPVREGQIVIASSSRVSKSPSRNKMSRLPLNPKSKPALRLPKVTKKKKVGDTSESIYDDNDMTLDNYTLSRSKSKDGENQGNDVDDEEGDDDSYFSEEDETFSDDGTGTDRQDDETYDDGYGYSDGEYTDQDSRIDGESTFDGSSTAFVDQPSLSFNSTFTPLVPLDSRNRTFSSRASRGSRETNSVHRNGTLSSRGSKVTQATLLSYNAFDAAKQNLQEEKKEEAEKADVTELLITPRFSNKLPAKPPTRPAFLSEVGLRLWTFFVLYSDSNNPSDNYVRQVADIFDEASFTGVGRLIAISLPAYASLYLPSGTDLSGLSFRDIASPKCRELIHKTCYFVGKYDFSLDDAGSRLIHRSSDGNTVVIRASEWIFTTEQTTTAVNPGISEAEIWATGEVPAELGLTFQSRERNVWIKFTKNAEVYKREVGSRVDLDVATDGDMDSPRTAVPLRSHFNAFETERKVDRCYKTDISDERFRELKLFGGIVDSSVSDSIILQEYPYALVYPASGHGSLADYYRQHGMNSTTQIKKICLQVSDALKAMHHTGIIHANVSMHNVVFFPTDGNKSAHGRWLLTNLAYSSRFKTETHHIGKITRQGFAHFSTGALPPEAFVKLSPANLKTYHKYWRAVARLGIQVDKAAIEPMVDFETGETYVVRCYYDPEDLSSTDAIVLPSLPYETLPGSESIDLWGLGQMLFNLCAGRPLFPVSSRDGQLLDYADISNWNAEMAASLIYKYVTDPLAQDILLRMLSPSEERKTLTLDTLAGHPFFSEDDPNASWVQQIVQKRKQETAAHARLLQNRACEVSDQAWLAERTVSINCFDFDLQTRIHLSPTEIIRGMMGRKTAIATPCSFVLLPYNLCHNKDSFLTPSTKKDVEMAERMGAELLGLSKACYFANAMKEAIGSSKESKAHMWSSTEVLRVLDFSSDDFGDVQSEMVELAARHVEAFRDNPMVIATKLVQQSVRRILSCFDDNKVFLYLVDEFNGVPVVRGYGDGLFPIEVSEENRDEILQRGILLMHLSCMYVRGAEQGISGLVRLIFEAADPHVPPSWIEASKGLKHNLDEVAIVNELRMLQDALSEMFSTRHHIHDDDLAVIRDYLSEVDPTRSVANMRRVTAGGACLWTTVSGAEEIESATQSFTFRDALKQRSEVDARLSGQEVEVTLTGHPGE